MSDILNKIKVALAGCGRGDFANFADAAKDLLKVLGYESDRTPENMSDAVADFVGVYKAPTPGLKSERDFLQNAVNVKLLFQFTDEEIAESKQRGLGLESLQEFNAGDNRSFYFVAADLKPKHYSRSDYARFVREINKRFNSPAVTLFRRPASDDAPASLTLGFVGRRPNMLQAERDVLEKVSLLREIQCKEPHRGHLDILDELSLDKRFNWIKSEKKSRNFDGLLAAWLDELDAEALNRRFYKALYKWFEWARAKAVFPCPPEATNNVKRAKAAADSVIRLITRMMFIWFIKEKKLVSDKLFYEEEVAPLLADYDAAKGDTYYRAILQNLFFATLNTEIRHREFNPEGQPGHRSGHGYRYKTLMANPKKIRALMNQTPFINGGLFDCLDSEEAGDFRADMFSDPDPKKWATARKKAFAALSVPNFLFFQDKKDLKAQRGLLTIFKKYKFTVEENTPVEQEVALDPELLGKVFENLLAEVNPETRESARNQTGSFYTPRAVVDYMTDESLVAYLSAKVPGNPGDGQWRQKLRDLFDYAKNECESIAKNKIAPLVGAIADIKVLDPACGSGAFPMGVLNKLALALSKLDPKNKEWKKFQEKRATAEAGKTFASVQSQAKRDKRLEEINETFTHYSDTFGRKLFLIQNSIFGVDIQPIACQIAKLRFFISLAIEQEKKGDAKKNFGIRPLPNLETRFVAADTLVRIHGMKEQGILGDEKIEQLRGKITDSRERHFNARTRNAKEKYRKEDKRLRDLLADALQANGFATAPAAHKISNWDLYNQNAFAEWFDFKWMFGIGNGFDVVIGNPPYRALQEDRGLLGNKYEGEAFRCFDRTGDIYMLFCERGLKLLQPGGMLNFIISNTWIRAKSGAKLRGVLTGNNPRMLVNMGAKVFENVYVDASILMVAKEKNRDQLQAADLNQNDAFPPSQWWHISPKGEKGWAILSPAEQKILAKVEKVGTMIKGWDVRIFRGATTGCNDAFVIDESIKQKICGKSPNSKEILEPAIRGRDIGRYAYQYPNLWLITTFPCKNLSIDKYPAVRDYLRSFGSRLEQSGKRGCRKKTPHAWFETSDTTAYYEFFHREKLMWIMMEGRFAYDRGGMYSNNSVFMMAGESIKYLLALLNSRLTRWQMSRVLCPTTGMGVFSWGKVYVEEIHIPRISKAEQRPFVALADKIIAAKAANPAADTSKMEAEIDKMVYALYGLTKGEIAIIESSAP